jgi:hypothetical protein
MNLRNCVNNSSAHQLINNQHIHWHRNVNLLNKRVYFRAVEKMWKRNPSFFLLRSDSVAQQIIAIIVITFSETVKALEFFSYRYG